MRARLSGLLPQSWFGAAPPNLWALLSGLASSLSWLYSLVAYTQNQCRVRTATDGFLDLVAQDYFGGALPRHAGESDAAFRTRILANLLMQKGTRAGLIATLTVLTGKRPLLFEPQRPADTGVYGGPYGGYGLAGGYGSAAFPNQALAVVYRGNGVATADIYAAIDGAKPAGTTIWTAIRETATAQPGTPAPGILGGIVSGNICLLPGAGAPGALTDNLGNPILFD